jgi:hypothetical protein
MGKRVGEGSQQEGLENQLFQVLEEGGWNAVWNQEAEECLLNLM